MRKEDNFPLPLFLGNGTTFWLIDILPLTWITNQQCRSSRNFKYSIHIIPIQSRTFDVSLRTNLPSYPLALVMNEQNLSKREGEIKRHGIYTAEVSMNRRDLRRISSIASGSSRKSLFRPTRTTGVPGHSRVISSYHCLVKKRVKAVGQSEGGRKLHTFTGTFSSETGSLTANPINITCALL